MAEDATNETGVGRSFEGVSSGQQQQQFESGESSVECTSSLEQVQNRSQSTSPCCDYDDDDDGGPKPSDLYGEYTWKIDDFSKIEHIRELRSVGCEVGGYKWRILAYPRGHFVEPNNEFFVFVASEPVRPFPGWSHLAQFTISAVNKDHKNSKYLSCLHNFENTKQNCGGMLMETTKLSDGFIDGDTLTIEAQVQFIRGREDQLFGCLDFQYRRKLVQFCFIDVEKIFRDFVEECGNKFSKLVNDESTWSRFDLLWRNMPNVSKEHMAEPNVSKEHMSKEKTDTIIKAIVKRFFSEKNVISSVISMLVMDYLYGGLKAIEGQNKKKKKGEKKSKAEELYVPMIRKEKDTFIPIGQLSNLFQRVAKEEGSTREENTDSHESHDTRLTKLGRRTIEIFFLEHILSKIEVLQKNRAERISKEILQKEHAQKTPKKTTKGKTKRKSVDKNNSRPNDSPLPNNLEDGHDEKTPLPTPPPYSLEEGHNEKTPSPQSDPVFKEIHHMRISDKEIGKGGSSIVYKGEFATREVAIKVTSYREKNPLKEVLNWVQADGHPNVVTYYGYECDTEEKLLYIALELCTCTLEELIVGTKELFVGTKELKFDPLIMRENRKLQMDVIFGIVSGLENLHDRGLIHRDLTPGNILIKITHTNDPKDQWKLCPKISDMGLIKDLLGEEGAKGSPEFHSYSENRKWKPPERAGVLTKKMDVFALGNIIAYVLSWGKSDDMNGPVNDADLDLWFKERQDALRLLKCLTRFIPEARPTLKEVKVDLFFWSLQKKLDFLSDCFEYFKGLKETSEERKNLEKLMKKTCDGRPPNWYCYLDDNFQKEADKGVPSGTAKLYNYKTMIDLLRFIRNKKHHIEELKITQVKLCEHLLDWFPNLVVEIYDLVSSNFKEVDSFQKYFYEM